MLDSSSSYFDQINGHSVMVLPRLWTADGGTGARSRELNAVVSGQQRELDSDCGFTFGFLLYLLIT